MLRLAVLTVCLCFSAGCFAATQKIQVPYAGPVLASKSAFPPRSLGQYLEICDPALDNDKFRRNNNNAYCAGYADALLEAAGQYRSACFPAEGVSNNVVLSIGQLRANKNRTNLQQNAFAQLLDGVAEQFPCKR